MDAVLRAFDAWHFGRDITMMLKEIKMSPLLLLVLTWLINTVKLHIESWGDESNA